MQRHLRQLGCQQDEANGAEYAAEGAGHGRQAQGTTGLAQLGRHGITMIAGFVGTYFKTHNAEESFRMGMACGAATAFTKDIAVKSQIDAVLPQIKVEQIS